MPRKPKAKAVEDPAPPTREEAKSQAKLLPFLTGDDDLAELALAADPRLASLFFVTEVASERAITKVLQMLSAGGKEEDELDRAIKRIMLKKLEEELETNKMLRQLLTPIVLQSYQKSKVEDQIRQCVSMKVMEYVSQGQPITMQLFQKAQMECQQLVSSSSDALGLLSLFAPSQSPSLPSQAQSQDNSTQTEVDESELGSL